MSADTPEELDALAAGYALGATTPEETAALEARLAASPELAADVRDYREVAVRLARRRAVAPPPALRAELLARLAADRAPTPAPTVTPVTPLASRRGGRAPIWLAVGLAASLLLAVGLVQQNRALRQQLARREATLDALLEAEKDLYVAQMTSADTVKGPGIQFFWNERQQKGIAHAFRLQPAPAGKSYQLWIIRDGKPESVKVFNSDPDGHALVEGLTLPAKAAGVTQVLLTLEPAGGSPLPTTTPFVGGTLVKS
jgi:anti-sigma-K factor RskA